MTIGGRRMEIVENYIKKTLRVFDVNAGFKTQDEVIEQPNTVNGILGLKNVKSGTTIYYGAETDNKTIGLYPLLK